MGASASGVWLSTEFRGTHALTRLERSAAVRWQNYTVRRRWRSAAKVNSLGAGAPSEGKTCRPVETRAQCRLRSGFARSSGSSGLHRDAVIERTARMAQPELEGAARFATDLDMGRRSGVPMPPRFVKAASKRCRYARCSGKSESRSRSFERPGASRYPDSECQRGLGATGLDAVVGGSALTRSWVRHFRCPLSDWLAV